ncbi:hypothetical protein ACN47E_008777 [Coniothyrium glycines]
MPSDNTHELPSDLISLHAPNHGRRPYQAYCVTEAASSRPCSPPYLDSSSSFSEHPRQKRRCVERAKSNETQNLLVGTRAQRNSREESPMADGQCKRKTIASSEMTTSNDITTAYVNRITQAVTPRGSHRLTPVDVAGCDGTRSQLLGHPRRGWSTFVLRRQLQDRNQNLSSLPQSIPRRPLPPLPAYVREIDGRIVYNVVFPAHKARQERPERSLEEEKHSITVQPVLQTARRVVSERGSGIDLRSSATSFAPDLRGPKSTLHVQGVQPQGADTAFIVDTPRYRRQELPLAVLKSLYKGDSLQHNVATGARDIHLRNVKNERSLDNLTVSTTPKRAPTQLHSYTNAKEQQSSLVTLDATITCVSPMPNEFQLGPRPPPWESLRGLELQRRQRNAARHAEVSLYAKKLDSSTSLLTESRVTNDSGDDARRREVDEYREQVLSVYPDIVFDGSAGKGNRSCCCYCAVM